MSGEWAQPYPPGYYEQLVAEANQVSLPRERRAAIVAELERMKQGRTADENRTDVETGGLGPRTVGRAPASNTGSIPVTAGEGGN